MLSPSSLPGEEGVPEMRIDHCLYERIKKEQKTYYKVLASLANLPVAPFL